MHHKFHMIIIPYYVCHNTKFASTNFTTDMKGINAQTIMHSCIFLSVLQLKDRIIQAPIVHFRSEYESFQNKARHL